MVNNLFWIKQNKFSGSLKGFLTMKKRILMCFLVLLNGFAYAKSERQILFACKTKNNKIIQLSKQNDRIHYQFGKNFRQPEWRFSVPIGEVYGTSTRVIADNGENIETIDIFLTNGTVLFSPYIIGQQKSGLWLRNSMGKVSDVVCKPKTLQFNTSIFKQLNHDVPAEFYD